jgi:lipopolysaccharide assembly outer membrane protein LptD (OstA)
MLISQDSYSLDFENLDANEPAIEFFNIKDYKITQEGIGAYSTASRAQRFGDRDILYDIDVLVMRKDGTDRLKSDSGTLKNNVFYLNGNVKYERADLSSLEAEAVEYHEDNKTLISKTPFAFETKGMRVFGDAFAYDMQNGQMNAENIKALIQARDR